MCSAFPIKEMPMYLVEKKGSWFLVGVALIAMVVVVLLPEKRNPAKRALRNKRERDEVRRVENAIRNGQTYDGLHQAN